MIIKGFEEQHCSFVVLQAISFLEERCHVSGIAPETEPRRAAVTFDLQYTQREVGCNSSDEEADRGNVLTGGWQSKIFIIHN